MSIRELKLKENLKNGSIEEREKVLIYVINNILFDINTLSSKRE